MEEKFYKKYEDYFRIGTAVNNFLLRKDKKLDSLVKEHFNLIVAENECKMVYINPKENKFNFRYADKLLKYAQKNQKDFRWHTLIWHNQSPKWIFTDKKGNLVSKEILEERMEKYISTVGKRYSKYVTSVDVVNECISDKLPFGEVTDKEELFKEENQIPCELRNGENYSKWYEIMGSEYIEKAFRMARKAFPNAELVINDYNLECIPQKRLAMYNLVKDLLEKNVPIDTVGLQMHIDIYSPAISEIEKTIEMFASLGVKVIITEMEVSVYHFMDKEKKEFTEELNDIHAKRYKELFECFRRQAKKGNLTDLVLWGVTDKYTWKNYFPVPGRLDMPLLFDRNGEAKKSFYSIMDF